MCGQPWACASVGPSGKRRRNHSATAGWKPSTAPWPAWPIGGASSGAVSWVTSLILPRGYDGYSVAKAEEAAARSSARAGSPSTCRGRASGARRSPEGACVTQRPVAEPFDELGGAALDVRLRHVGRSGSPDRRGDRALHRPQVDDELTYRQAIEGGNVEDVVANGVEERVELAG